MRNQDFVRAGMVELVIKHMAGCCCDLETPDPEATVVQLGCVTGYLVERSSATRPNLLGIEAP